MISVAVSIVFILGVIGAFDERSHDFWMEHVHKSWAHKLGRKGVLGAALWMVPWGCILPVNGVLLIVERFDPHLRPRGDGR